MERRTYLKGIGTVSAVGLLAGCSDGESDGTGDEASGGTSGDATGLLATTVSDMPGDIGDFESLIVTVAGVWIKPAEADGTTTPSATSEDATPTSTPTATGGNATATEAEMEEGDDGRRYVEFSEPHDADLVQLQGSKTQLLEEREVAVGEYEFLQLDVTDSQGTLTDGSETSVETPGNAPLKFDQSFEIREDERTTFVADFTPFQRGNGSYLIRPVASETQVLYGEETPSGGTPTASGDGMTDGGSADGGNATGDGSASGADN